MQFIDLKAQYAALKTEIDDNIQEALNPAAFTSAVWSPANKSQALKWETFKGVKKSITNQACKA